MMDNDGNSTERIVKNKCERKKKTTDIEALTIIFVVRTTKDL